MRRAKGLCERVCHRDNLLVAVRRALRGKRGKPDARAYVADLERNLNALAAELRGGLLTVGRSTQFAIHDPKERLITAPFFAERVLHHAIMNVCEPEFERRLIHHTYACRRGKGQFAGLAAARRFASGHGWFLQMDVRKFFESIPKDNLLDRLERVFAEREVLSWFRQIVLAHEPGSLRGLPIGSLISQHCANLYLDGVDRVVTQGQRSGAYVRYMDDFVAWSGDRERLRSIRDAVEEQLRADGMAFKTKPSWNRTERGMNFLGHRVLPGRVEVSRISRIRYTRKVRGIGKALASGVLTESEAQAKLTACTAFASYFGGADWRRHAIFPAGGMPEAPTA